jgi:hypothetical protein
VDSSIDLFFGEVAASTSTGAFVLQAQAGNPTQAQSLSLTVKDSTIFGFWYSVFFVQQVHVCNPQHPHDGLSTAVVCATVFMSTPPVALDLFIFKSPIPSLPGQPQLG